MALRTTNTEMEFFPVPEKIPDQTGIVADDAISLYLNEMDRVPLLTRDEEVELATRMAQGRAARERLLALAEAGSSPKEHAELISAIEAGKAAREHLIKANIRLVVNMAKKYRHYSQSFLDLIQAGNLGLIRAVDRFDSSRGNRFSTYATWWIRRAVLRHLNQKERNIRLPNYLTLKIRKVVTAQKNLTAMTGNSPTMAEIGAVLGKPAEEVEQLLTYSQRTVSLDEPMGEEGDASMEQFIVNDDAPHPFEEVYERSLVDEIGQALKYLSERESQILIMRYGLNGSRKYTLKELGEAFGITRERIRQIQKSALLKLQSPEIYERLNNYL